MTKSFKIVNVGLEVCPSNWKYDTSLVDSQNKDTLHSYGDRISYFLEIGRYGFIQSTFCNCVKFVPWIFLESALIGIKFYIVDEYGLDEIISSPFLRTHIYILKSWLHELIEAFVYTDDPWVLVPQDWLPILSIFYKSNQIRFYRRLNLSV